jgi:hypothetical protein
MQTCCYMYSLGIQCKWLNIPDHAFYSYSVLNRSLSYICNISFLEVHLERVQLDLIGTRMLCSIDHPQSFASILSASPIHCFTWWNTRKIWKCAAFDVGSKNDAINYRGITVLPVISKIVKAVIRDRIQPLIHNMQNPTQRGFTKGSSLMNAALPVEEAIFIFFYTQSVILKSL